MFASILLTAIVVAACAPAGGAPDAPQPLPSPAGDWKLKLTQSGGFAGVNLTVEIDSHGQLTATDKRTGRTVSQSLPADTMRRLSQLYSQVSLTTPRGPGSGCADCFIYSLELSSGGRPMQIQLDDTTLAGSGMADLIQQLQQLRDRALKTAP
jgi:hypothetical protein